MSAKIDNRQRTFLEVPIRAWRPIHYLGSKLRLTDSICEYIADLSDGPVCDLFSGSGTVSLALSKSHDVLAADIQEYSRVLCTALLQPSSISDQDVAHLLARAERYQAESERCIEPLLEYERIAMRKADSRPELLADLVDHGSLMGGEVSGPLGAAVTATKRRLKKAGSSLMATRYFGGRYFSFQQAIFIDSILNENAGATYSAALLSTASEIVNSIGKQFAQPMRPRRSDGSVKLHLIRQMCRDRTQNATEVFTAWLARYRAIRQSRPHRVVRGDYREVLKSAQDIAVIYADPPYTRDHYSRFYHVLETLCLQDWPEVTSTFETGPVSRGLYRSERHQSPFCIKSQAPGAFAELFTLADGLPMLISYSPFVKDGHPRMMTVDAVAEIAKRHYRKVRVIPTNLVHSKLNKTDLHLGASDRAEVFVVCR